MKYKGVELTEAQLRAGMQCESAEEFRELCGKLDIKMTQEEAKKAFAALDDLDLTAEEMKIVAGGLPDGPLHAPVHPIEC
jgi:hypothetical protein